MDNDRQLMTAKEIANIFGVSNVTIFNWAKAGRLTRIRLGPRTFRFRRDQVEDLMKNGTDPAGV